MNKKLTERILIGVVAAILVLYGIYQVAYGTNESSYKYGLHYANVPKCNYACTNRDVSIPLDCYGSVDNVTACVDGSIHAFIHQGQPQVVACILSHDDWAGGQCNKVVATTGPGHCYNTTKEGETCESGNWIPTDHH